MRHETVEALASAAIHAYSPTIFIEEHFTLDMYLNDLLLAFLFELVIKNTQHASRLSTLPKHQTPNAMLQSKECKAPNDPQANAIMHHSKLITS